eukprot:4491886-Pyramimonas_sp.AAC.1
MCLEWTLWERASDFLRLIGLSWESCASGLGAAAAGGAGGAGASRRACRAGRQDPQAPPPARAVPLRKDS